MLKVLIKVLIILCLHNSHLQKNPKKVHPGGASGSGSIPGTRSARAGKAPQKPQYKPAANRKRKAPQTASQDAPQPASQQGSQQASQPASQQPSQGITITASLPPSGASTRGNKRARVAVGTQQSTS